MKNKVLAFDVKNYEEDFLKSASGAMGIDVDCIPTRLTPSTLNLCHGQKVISCFVNDDLSAPQLEVLSEMGVELILLRCAGYNNVDGEALVRLPLKVCRVPEYSPQSVAEFSLALLLNLTRKIHKSYARTRELNFTLDGLVGFDLKEKTIGVIGTGKIGTSFVNLMSGFQAHLVATDVNPNSELKGFVEYLPLGDLLTKSDIVMLHVPLNHSTQHLINTHTLSEMKDGVIIFNTSRGGLIETSALIGGLKSGKVGAAALDVYEEESEFFFKDFSERILNDDVLARLMTFPNVIVTSHQGYLTENALNEISSTVAKQAKQYFEGKAPDHIV